MAKDKSDGGGKKGPGGFNTPFKNLKWAPSPPAEKKTPAPAPPRARVSKEQNASTASDEDRLFLEAMAGVAPIPARPTEPPREVPRINFQNEEAEALATLAEMVSSAGSFDISDSNEVLEGTAPGLDKRVLRSLRRGDYAVQAELDLHGMNRSDAKLAVENFLVGARRNGKRCVLIIHGKGLNSKDQIPVLKELLRVLLNVGKVSKSVLAFCSARPQEGGSGALYVLLRK